MASITGVRGLRIEHQTWVPPDPHAVVVVAHGFAEHGGRYAHLAERLNQAGYAVRIPDHRGHGRSEGARTSVVRFDDYVADLLSIIELSRGDWRGRPILL